MAHLRLVNREAVLQLVQRRQPLSRADIARLSGLQKSTVGEIVEDLLRAEVITEETTRVSRGRPPRMLTIGRKLAIPVVELSLDGAQVTILGSAGEILSVGQVPMHASGDAFTARLADCLRSTKREHRFDFNEGVALVHRPAARPPGTDDDLDAVGMETASVLRQALQMELIMVRPAEACLRAEMWSGHLDGVRHAVVLSVEADFDTAVLVGGQMMRGRQGRAVGFAHVCLDPEGPACRCGRNGCWAALAAPEALLWLSRRLSPALRAPRSVAVLLRQAARGEPLATECVTRYAGYIAEGIRIVVETLQPEQVLLSGQVVDLWPQLEAHVQTSLDRAGVQPPPIRAVACSRTALLQGTAMAVTERRAGQRRSWPMH